MVVARYCPRKGDLVVVSFDPQSGHEQQGRRPALVISNETFNRHTGLAIACPITSTDRGFPFHLRLADDSPVSGFVMVEQIKSLDFASRRAKFIGQAPADLVDHVLALLEACLR